MAVRDDAVMAVVRVHRGNGSRQEKPGAMRQKVVVFVAILLVGAGCGGDSKDSIGSQSPAISTSMVDSSVTTRQPPETTATTTSGTSTTVPADTGLPAEDSVSAAGTFNSAEVTSESIVLSPEALKLFDGLLLSVNAEVRFDDGALGGRSVAVGVADGEAHIIKGMWCVWEFERALNGFDGSVLFVQDRLFVCTPGERFRPVSGYRGKPLATARVDGRAVALVSSAAGLLDLYLDTLEYQPFFELGTEKEHALSASYGAEQWVVILSESGPDLPEPASRRIVFLDGDGSVITHEHNPFAELGNRPGPRAAALTSDGASLVFSIDEADGSSSLVFWDLEQGTETARHPITGPFVPGDDPYGFGREYVSSIDISGDRILVNVTATGGESHPSQVLLFDLDGNVTDLTAQDELAVAAAVFLQH